jgi:AP-1 complex subunit mu
MCRAEFSLPSITAEEGAPEKKPPIRVKFEIPYFTVSGIQVISDFSVFHFSPLIFPL